MTTQPITAIPPRRIRIRIQPHRLGMGWHYIWEYDPPIEHHVRRGDGTSYSWHETGEASEGCIMWLADCFAREHLGTTAREIYYQTYKTAADNEFEDDWLETDVLRGMTCHQAEHGCRLDRQVVAHRQHTCKMEVSDDRCHAARVAYRLEDHADHDTHGKAEPNAMPWSVQRVPHEMIKRLPTQGERSAGEPNQEAEYCRMPE